MYIFLAAAFVVAAVLIRRLFTTEPSAESMKAAKDYIKHRQVGD